MKRVKLTVAYDGTHYCGWQTQPNGITVQEVLEKHLSELLKEPIRIAGASRTDAGVHAKGNVAVFDTQAGRKDFLCIKYQASGRYPDSGILPGAGKLSSQICQNGKDV